jgi:hypothetical protein
MELSMTLDIVVGDTEPVVFYIQQDGAIMNIAGYTILLRVGTGVVTQISCSIVDAATGKCSFVPSTIVAGVWQANFKINGLTTGQFTINATAGI